jgi:predicted RNA-binding protein associated with RNAse of E/G family
VTTLPRVHIHYLRPPARKDVFTQTLLLDSDAVKVTLAQDLTFDPPLIIQDGVVLETGSSAVWFTFPDHWHDIGLFYRADGSFSGTYANILTPPIFESTVLWRTTDLFLDVWVGPDGGLAVLDRDQFEHAASTGTIDAELATGALAELSRIETSHAAGVWPPVVVNEWSLERALSLTRAATP